MTGTIRTSILSALIASLVTAMLVGGLWPAGAQTEGEARVAQGFYVKTKVYSCASGTCSQPAVIAKCKVGDPATGGSAHIVENGGFTHGFTARSWGGSAIKPAKGWQADPQGAGPDFLNSGDKLIVKAICQDQS